MRSAPSKTVADGPVVLSSESGVKAEARVPLVDQWSREPFLSADAPSIVVGCEMQANLATRLERGVKKQGQLGEEGDRLAQE